MSRFNADSRKIQWTSPEVLVATLLCVALLLSTSSCQRTQSFKDPARRALHRLEKIDVDTMLNNNRIMANYVKCFVGKGPCSPEARDFRKLIPRLTSTACGWCTPNQRRLIKKVFLFMYTQRNDDWNALQESFDPKKKFEKKICNFMGVTETKNAPKSTTTTTTTTSTTSTTSTTTAAPSAA